MWIWDVGPWGGLRSVGGDVQMDFTAPWSALQGQPVQMSLRQKPTEPAPEEAPPGVSLSSLKSDFPGLLFQNL